MTRIPALAVVALLACWSLPGQAREYLETNEMQKARAFGAGVLAGGHHRGRQDVWLAGQTTLTDLNGKSIAGDFEAQARTVFALIGKTLERAGGKLSDLVTMTVFITDVRNGDKLVEIRRELFPDGKFPGSALITVTGLARPGMLVEVQAIAVIGDK
ncbi:MAG: RidA family protein [Pseudomonadota bacterium]